MKKHKTLIIILSIFLGIILLIITVFGVSALSHNAKLNSSFTLDEDYMDTAYNNAFLSRGNLAYADGKLHYNYCPYSKLSGAFSYGIYTITDKGSYRSFYDGPKLLASDMMSPMMVIQGKLYGIDGEPFGSDIESEAESFEYLADREKTLYRDIRSTDRSLFRYTYYNIYRSMDGANEEEVFTQAYDIQDRSENYLTDHSITYLGLNGHLKEYDFDKQEFTIDVNLSEYGFQVTDPYDLITYAFVTPLKCGEKTLLFISPGAEDEYLYEVTDDNQIKLLYIREYSGTDISGEMDYNYYNACGDYVFISNRYYGITKINVNNGKSETIVPSGTKDIYVFGNKWIYYTKNDYRLYRTSQDGKITEKVF